MKMKTPKEFGLPYNNVEKIIEKGIKNYFDGNGYCKALIGISGGLDSTVTAYLTARGIGSDKLVGVTMNDTITSVQDRDDAEKVIKELKIKHLDVGISSVNAEFASLVKHELFKKSPLELKKIDKEKGKLAYANIKPRLRMSIIYFFANILYGTVIGTSDKSEILLGYYTKYGDGAADFLPIGDLYKTQVRALGEYMNIPESIISKKSSPGLIPNLTAEGELGFDYTSADLVFYYRFEKKLSVDQISNQLNMDKCLVNKILTRVEISSHKRELPKKIKIRR